MQPSSPDTRRDEVAPVEAPASDTAADATGTVADLAGVDRAEPEGHLDSVVTPAIETKSVVETARRVAATPAPAIEAPATAIAPLPPADQPPVASPAPAAAPARPATVPADLPPESGASAARSGLVDHGATAPQLRRFIKSRAYVPMHELRRRFGINGGDDDVTALEVDRRVVYVGLPPREGRLLGELLSGGDIGVELSLDPVAPIVVGVFPTRPIPRS